MFWKKKRKKTKQYLCEILDTVRNYGPYICGRLSLLERHGIACMLPFLKDEMVRRKLFDEKYYTSSYPEYKKYGLSPLDHYINVGWKLGYNPSESFDTNAYIESVPYITYCPLIHFLLEGRYIACYGYFSNPYSSPEYNFLKNNKKVVYTCIVGNYDALIQQAYVDSEWDYVCFTDNPEMLKNEYIGHWKIRPLYLSDLDKTRINRFHKINTHIVLPEYEESLYIDANVNILSPFIFDLIKARNSDLLISRHFSNTCAYEHSKWILSYNIDDPVKVNDFLRLMKKSGFPANYGMTENNIIYRKHNKDSIKIIDEDWWSFVKNYSKRDQLSLSYVLWKHNIKIDDISYPNARSDIDNFMLVKHKKEK